MHARLQTGQYAHERAEETLTDIIARHYEEAGGDVEQTIRALTAEARDDERVMQVIVTDRLDAICAEVVRAYLVRQRQRIMSGAGQPGNDTHVHVASVANLSEEGGRETCDTQASNAFPSTPSTEVGGQKRCEPHKPSAPGLPDQQGERLRAAVAFAGIFAMPLQGIDKPLGAATREDLRLAQRACLIGAKAHHKAAGTLRRAAQFYRAIAERLQDGKTCYEALTERQLRNMLEARS